MNPASLPDRPSFLSDFVGTALAAVLGLAGMLATLPLGLCWRDVVIPRYQGWTPIHPQTPQVPTLVVIGTIALLPHPIMIGIDLHHTQTYRATS